MFLLQSHQDRVGSWPWCGPADGGLAEARFRYSFTTLTVPRRCLGLARRRLGRGGRSVHFLFFPCSIFWQTFLLTCPTVSPSPSGCCWTERSQTTTTFSTDWTQNSSTCLPPSRRRRRLLQLLHARRPPTGSPVPQKQIPRTEVPPATPLARPPLPRTSVTYC